MLIRERKRWMWYLKSDPSLNQNLNLNRLISHSLFSLVKLMMCLMRQKKNEERIAEIVKKASIRRFCRFLHIRLLCLMLSLNVKDQESISLEDEDHMFDVIPKCEILKWALCASTLDKIEDHWKLN
ncbi:hypothetical protein Hanom_Chr11g00981581 [Helianthus anomalus]